MKKNTFKAWYYKNGIPQLVDVVGEEHDQYTYLVSTKFKGNEVLAEEYNVFAYGLIDKYTGLGVAHSKTKEGLVAQYEKVKDTYIKYRTTKEYEEKKKDYEEITKELRLFI